MSIIDARTKAALDSPHAQAPAGQDRRCLCMAQRSADGWPDMVWAIIAIFTLCAVLVSSAV